MYRAEKKRASSGRSKNRKRGEESTRTGLRGMSGPTVRGKKGGLILLVRVITRRSQGRVKWGGGENTVEAGIDGSKSQEEEQVPFIKWGSKKKSPMVSNRRNDLFRRQK